MSKVVELQEKVSKAQEKVDKCKKTIERHEKQLEKKIKNGAEDYEIRWKENDIKGANKKLQDAERILNNWEEKLSVEKEKERFLENNAPQVIKDFLEEWKEKAFEWHVRRYDSYIKFCQELREEEKNARIECLKVTPEYKDYLDENGNPNRTDLLNVFPRKPMEEYLKERDLDWKSIQSRKVNFAGHAVLKMCEFRDEVERLKWLDRQLENEKKAKMLDLINRINKVVGEITDASNLKVSVKGNLDGFIEGVKGKAKVETVGCGGWNIQVFHFRTLVNKI